MKGPLFIIIVVACVLILRSGLFIVDETNQVVITRFGKVQNAITEPGLYFRIPVIDMAFYYDKRVLDYDSKPQEIITQDKKTMVIDNYAKWIIDDLTKFYTNVGTLNRAVANMDDTIYSFLREILGKYTLDDIVSEKRQAILNHIVEIANEKTQSEYGIKVLDVRIKSADLPKENEMAVFGRMKTEREKQAKLYRAEGEQEATMIRAKTDMDVQIIISEAQMKAEQVRGEGDAEALKIYAESFTSDPDFYEFYRTLQAYDSIMTEKDVIIFGTENEIFKYLRDVK